MRWSSVGSSGAAQALIDLGYDDGKWVIERVKKERSVAIEAVTVCCHGDAPNAVAEVAAAAQALKTADVEVGPLAARRRGPEERRRARG